MDSFSGIVTSNVYDKIRHKILISMYPSIDSNHREFINIIDDIYYILSNVLSEHKHITNLRNYDPKYPGRILITPYIEEPILLQEDEYLILVSP